jgi:hypothetical protein
MENQDQDNPMRIRRRAVSGNGFIGNFGAPGTGIVLCPELIENFAIGFGRGGR